MPRYTYTGDQRVIYSHYLDVSDPENVTTLVPEPGQVYEIEQADSPRVIQPDGQFTEQELAMPPDGNFEETTDPTWAEVKGQEEAEASAKLQASSGLEPPPSTGGPKPQAPKPAVKKKEQQADG